MRTFSRFFALYSLFAATSGLYGVVNHSTVHTVTNTKPVNSIVNFSECVKSDGLLKPGCKQEIKFVKNDAGKIVQVDRIYKEGK